MAQTTEVAKAPAPAPKATPELEDKDIEDAAEEAQVPKKINWGGILKGALIVTAVVVVGVAAFYIGSGFVSSLIANSTTAQGIVAMLGSIGSYIGGVATQCWGFISGAASSISGTIGLTPILEKAGSFFNIGTQNAQIALDSATPIVTKTAGWLTGGLATLAALPVAKALLADTHALVPDHGAMLSSGAQASAAAHHGAHQSVNMAKLGKHAMENNDHHAPAKKWTETVAQRPPVTAAASKPAASFTEQVTQREAAQAGNVNSPA